jgi:hypothetical protein
MFNGRRSPVAEVPEEVLLDWGAENLVVRDRWIAAHIQVMTTGADGLVSLSTAAQTLLSRAADRGPILEALGRNVLPNNWQGSYQIATAPLAVFLERLAAAPDTLISEWAKEHLQRISDRVEIERGEIQQREETFE